MPRIPDELIERIKSEIPILRLAERAGIEFKAHGENLVGFCPFHPDRKTPNLVLTPAKNVFHCFACGAAGSVIDWVMLIEGVRIRAAIDILLLEFFPLEARALGIGSPPKRSSVPKLPSPIDPESSEEEIAYGVVRYYRDRLEQSPEALAFLARRGLDTPEVIQHFQLGYSDRTIGSRIPLGNRKAGQAIRSTLQKIGIYRDTDREHLIGCVTVPLFDAQGNVAGMYGRRIQASAIKHLYTAGEHGRGLLNRQAFEMSKEIVLCEGPLDAMTFFRWGFRNVTTTFGAKVFTDELLSAFVTHGIERCFIAFDRDDAGEDGARKAAEKLMARGIECLRVLFPKGMDANEYALKVQPGDKSLGVLLRGAEWMGRAPSTSAPRARDAGVSRDRAGTGDAGAPAANEASSSQLLLAANDEIGEAAKEENGSQAARKAGSEALDTSRIERKSQGEAGSGAVSGRIEAAGEGPETSAPLEMMADAAIEPPIESPHGPSHAPSRPSATPPASSAVAGVELTSDDEALFRFEDRSYRVQGLKKALRSGSLHVTVNAQREGDFFDSKSPISGSFLDRFDFVSSLARMRFEKNAAQEMGVKPETVKWDLGQVVRRLEQLQEKARLEALTPKTLLSVMTDEQRADGLDYGSAPDLIERILGDYDRSGVVGEKVNKIVGYLGAVSRLSDRPLAIIIRSSSAAGKSALMDAILRFVPKDAKEKYSALSGHALFYFEGKDFKHKILGIVEEEGAQKASYALKLLQSEGEITIASTGKDPGTGRLVTKEYRVEGPVMIFLCSTHIDIDDELLNRAIVLTVDEGREQTRAIHRLQRESQTLDALWAQDERDEIYRRHHSFQQLLRPFPVVNPYVRELTFLDDRTRTRRDHTKYLGLIEAVTLLHQFQRPLKSDTRGGMTKEYIEATLDDIALANRLACEVLGRTLDELGPQTRRFLMLLDEMVTLACEAHGIGRSDVRLSRRQIRDYSGFQHSQLAIHLARLVEMEYLIAHHGGRGQTFVYELLYDGKGRDGSLFVIGLCDVEALAKAHGLPIPSLPPSFEPIPSVPTIETFRPEEATFRGHSGAIPGSFRWGSGTTKPAEGEAPDPISHETAENSHLEAWPKSYAQAGRSDNPDTNRNANPRAIRGEARTSRPSLVNLLRFPPMPKNKKATEAA